MSASYNNVQDTALTPDNWFFTEAVTLPADKAITLSYFVGAADSRYYKEHYGVYVATAPSAASATLLKAETLTTASCSGRTANLSDYAGQTVYIGFRHFISSDEFKIALDQIEIYAKTGGCYVPFTDVPSGKWFYSAVEHAVRSELFNGIDETTFAPNGAVTRAMLVTVLWRMEGKPESDAENPFRDVPPQLLQRGSDLGSRKRDCQRRKRKQVQSERQCHPRAGCHHLNALYGEHRKISNRAAKNQSLTTRRAAKCKSILLRALSFHVALCEFSL